MQYIDSFSGKLISFLNHKNLLIDIYCYKVGNLLGNGSESSLFSKFDTFGNTIIIKELAFHYPSNFTNICQSADNNLYTGGSLYTDTANKYLITTALICKLDTGGNQLWKYEYLAPYANIPYGIIATADSGVLVSLTSGGYVNNNQAILLKLDKVGHKQWEKQLPFNKGLYSCELIDYLPASKEYILMAVTYGENSNGRERDSIVIVKVDSNMNRVWTLRNLVSSMDPPYPDSTAWGIGTLIKARTGYVGVGTTPRQSGTILKIDDAGHIEWQGIYSQYTDPHIIYGSFQQFNSIDTMPDGGYIVGGSTRDSLGHQVGFIMRIGPDGCLRTDTCEARIYTGIETLPSTSLRLYPNPSTGAFTLETTGAVGSALVVTDVLGRVVWSGQIHSDREPIQLHGIEAGTYYLAIRGESSSGIVRLVVE